MGQLTLKKLDSGPAEGVYRSRGLTLKKAPVKEENVPAATQSSQEIYRSGGLTLKKTPDVIATAEKMVPPTASQSTTSWREKARPGKVVSTPTLSKLPMEDWSVETIRQRAEALRPSVEAAEQERKALESAMMSMPEMGDLGEYRAMQDKLTKAAGKADKLSGEYDELLGRYYDRENREKLDKLKGDTAAAGQYSSAKELRGDIERIQDLMGYMTSELAQYGDEDKARVDTRYLAQQYGLDESAIKKFSEGGGAGYETLGKLQQTLEGRLETAKAALAEAGYDFERMAGYEKTRKDREEYAQKQEEWKRYAEEHPVQASIATIVASPFQGIDYGRLMLEGRGKSDDKDIERYVPMNVYNMDTTNFVNTVRGTVSQKIEDNTDWELFGQNVASFLYQTGMSVADSSVQIATMGNAAALFMGASAASSQAKSVIERGGTNKQAFWGGLAAGAAECIFEWLSIDKLLKPKSISSVKDLLKETAKQAGVEASEEIFTEISNILTDAAIMGQKSDWAQMVAQYRLQDMSETEAQKQAFLDCVGRVVWAGAGGALSGGMMGGTVSALNYAGNVYQANMEAAEMEQVQKTAPEVGAAESTQKALTPYSQHEAENFLTGAKNKVLGFGSSILEFAKSAIQSKGGAERLYCGKIPQETADMIFESTGQDVSEFNFVMSGDSVWHAYNRHKNDTEATGGKQVSLRVEDMSVLPSVIANPDRVEIASRKDGHGRTALIFTKKIRDTVVTITGISAGRKTLDFDTMRVKKEGSPTVDRASEVTGPPLTSKTNSGQTLLPDTTVTQEAEGVKGEVSVDEDSFEAEVRRQMMGGTVEKLGDKFSVDDGGWQPEEGSFEAEVQRQMMGGTVEKLGDKFSMDHSGWQPEEGSFEAEVQRQLIASGEEAFFRGLGDQSPGGILPGPEVQGVEAKMEEQRSSWLEGDPEGTIEVESDALDSGRRAIKGLVNGKKVIGFHALPEKYQQSFREGLAGATPETRAILGKVYENADYVTVSERRSHYLGGRWKNIVCIGRSATPSTIAHELFHLLDRKRGVSQKLSKSLTKDFVALTVTSEGDIQEYLLWRFPEMFERNQLLGRVICKAKYRGISDILNGLSEGEIFLGFGHSKEYWAKPWNVEKEAWAQFGRMMYENDPEALKVLNTLFPNFTRDAIITSKELM